MDIRISVSRGRESPFVAVPFAVHMQMRTRYFPVIRISVRGAIEVEAHEDDGLPRPILESGLCQSDLGARDVEYKILRLSGEVRAIATLPPGSGNLRDIDISHLKNFC